MMRPTPKCFQLGGAGLCAAAAEPSGPVADWLRIDMMMLSASALSCSSVRFLRSAGSPVACTTPRGIGLTEQSAPGLNEDAGLYVTLRQP